MTFTAIDFELATAAYNSVCALGIVKVEDNEIVHQFHSLIKPPQNKYMWQTTRVHGIRPKDTATAPSFQEIFPEIRPYLDHVHMVAHNEKFDREVLMKTMQYYGLDYKELGLAKVWDCTSEIYRSKGFAKTKLSVCCRIMGVELHHHDPLSDAKASATLYMMKDRIDDAFIELHFPKTEQKMSNEI